MNLSLDEKLSLLSGVGFWHTKSLNNKIKHLELSDGPHGLRKQAEKANNNNSEPAICYPTASALACTFDTELIAKIGDELGKEAKEKGVSILLGPGVNMKRSPLCGRNFEYFSEDPYLAGSLATSYINGVQKNGVGTSLKHFAANSQETHRMRSDSVIDERTLREIYLKAFEMTVKGSQPATLMASYNLINGTYSTENKWLLTDVLRNEWGFKGSVVSDWGACTNLTKAVKAGMDLEMPDSFEIHKNALKKDLEDGIITEEEIDRAINNIEKLLDLYGMSDEEEASFVPPSMDEYLAKDSTKRRHKLAYTASVNAGVLLKNEGILPLHPQDTIALIGDLAIQTRFQGGGSSHINAGRYPTVLDCLKKHYPDLFFARGYDCMELSPNESMEKEAINASKDAEIIVFCGGLTDLAEGEGYDRDTLKMPENQIHLLHKLMELGKKTVFLSFGGAPFEMECLEQFDSVLQMYLGGEAVAEAAVDLLTGLVNPSGHLAETWPFSIKDTPAFHNFGSREKHVPYHEGLFIGYRHYNTKKIPVQFPFGYGLSYTDFVFDNLSVIKKEDGFSVSFTVTNTGNRAGKAVPQLYVRNAAGDYERAEVELRGFTKISLNPEETREVNMELGPEAFQIYDVSSHSWVIPEGEYGILVGCSVEEIILSETVFVEGVKNLSIPKPELVIKEEEGEKFSITSSYAELSEYSEIARNVLDQAMKQFLLRFPDKGPDDPEVHMMMEMFKDGTGDSTTLMSGGAIPYDTLYAIIEEANRNYKAGVKVNQ